VHDGIFFEKAGIPVATFATTEFANAARAQADALGMPDYEVILVQHPIQPLTQDEVYARADAVYEQLIEKLTKR
jgi:phosphoribosylcarboxyaminoimidazole (NCAIR) mutase